LAFGRSWQHRASGGNQAKSHFESAASASSAIPAFERHQQVSTRFATNPRSRRPRLCLMCRVPGAHTFATFECMGNRPAGRQMTVRPFLAMSLDLLVTNPKHPPKQRRLTTIADSHSTNRSFCVDRRCGVRVRLRIAPRRRKSNRDRDGLPRSLPVRGRRFSRNCRSRT
jgi:hypothetical protein